MFRSSLAGTVKNVNPEDARALADPESVDSSLDGVYVFPAGLEQSRYWLLDQLAGASTASNMAVAFRLQGPIQDEAAEQAVRALVLRHEALRTTFRMIDDALAQVISEEAAYEFAVSDLRTLPEADRPQRAEELIHEHSRIHIDLANGPALYVRLIHVTDADHFLAFTVHHIACDGWSNGVLIRDFAEIHSAAIEKREPSLPELPFQFADFTVWQQSWLESEAAQAALGFWKEHIRREMPAIDLPTDHPRTAQKSAPGNIEGWLLSPELTSRLKAYGRQHDATMHQVLLAAFEALIARYTGQTEFLLGSTIANRTQPGMENVVGRFAHPQVILADVRGNPSYRELLARVIDWSAKAYAHQDLPFSRLAEQFQIDQAGATSQFLQVYFVYQKAFMQPQVAGELRIIPRPSVSGGVNFDMLVSIVERNEGPRLQIEYNTLLFERERVLRLLEQYTRVLEAVMDNDILPVSALPLVSEEERSTLAAAATPTPTAAVTGAPEQTACGSLTQLFDSHAAALSDSPALIVGGARIGWSDLRARSIRFAHTIQRRGLCHGQTVAIRIEPNADTAAAAIAALRLGLAILPIPAGASAAEWQKIQMTLKPALCIAGPGFAAEPLGVTCFTELETGSYDADAHASDLPDPTGSGTAWLGAVVRGDGSYEWIPVSQVATIRSMQSSAGALGIKAGDVVLIASPTVPLADAWTDLLLPLLSGATVVYPEREKAEQLRSVIDREQVSFAFGTPAEWLHVLDSWAGDRRLNIVCRGSRLATLSAGRLAKSTCRVWSLISATQTAGPFALARLDPNRQELPLSPLPG
ncbi:MAG: AMP-binding protein, partial [Acidobacteriaceae bacterium]|nr:AMP-binding protein [Acidobacteriaceae bacterium]